MKPASQHIRSNNAARTTKAFGKNAFGFNNPWGLAFWLAGATGVASAVLLQFVMPSPSGVVSAIAVWCGHLLLPALLGFLVWRVSTGEAIVSGPAFVLALAVRAPLLFPVWNAAHGALQLSVELGLWFVGVVMAFTWLQTLNKLSGK